MLRRRLVAIATATALLTRAAAAGTAPVETPKAQSEYMIDTWEADDGLPQNSVLSITQTADGYLWLSTFEGLARFDGRRFDVFNGENCPALSGETILHLHGDAAGNLWMLDDKKRLLAGRNGHFHLLDETDGLPPGGRSSFTEDEDGDCWIGDDKGRLLKYSEGHFVVVMDAPPAPDWGPIGRVRIDASGKVWTWNRRRCVRLADGKWTTVFETKDGERLDFVKPSPDGSVLIVVGTNPPRVLRYTDGSISEDGVLPEGFDSRFMSIGADGNWWLSAQSGGFRRDPEGRWTRLTREWGLPTDTLRCTMVDREGNRWFGTEGSGLFRLRPRVAKAVGTANGLERKVVATLAGDGTNGFWAGVSGGPLNHFDGSRFSPVLLPSPMNPNGEAWCVLPAPRGGVWVGTYGQGLCLAGAGGDQREHFNWRTQPGMVRGPITALFRARNGDMWIGGQHGGIARYADGQFHLWTKNDGLIDNYVFAIGEDRAGTIWAGTEGGLNEIATNGVKTFTSAEGLSGDRVLAIGCDSRGSLWIGGRGLTRLKDGHFSAIGSSDGLPVDTISAIIEDDLGYLWFATRHGILRAGVKQLNDYCETRSGPPEFKVLTKADGLPSNQCGGRQPTVWKGNDGRLWFATLNGVAVIDPKHVTRNKVPPPVVIKSVEADGTTQELQAARDGSRLMIPAGTSLLEFRYVALSYSAPEANQYRHRLDGFDTAWIKGGTSPTASYTRPPPGDYRFEVRACNNDGVWNQSGATLAITVLPFYWQTTWFQMLLGAGTIGLILAYMRAHLARLENRRRAQEAFARQVIEKQEEERQRIAQELHDGVGQALILAKNHLLQVTRRVGASSSVHEQLGQVSSDVSEALEEIRATARALRPAELDRLGLAKALEAMLERSGATTSTRFCAELDETPGLVRPENEIQLYRIAQEAINNVLKHSKADEVIVELKREGSNLRLTVQDDGAGFDPDQSGPGGGSGLSGMSERARLIGGELTVKAAPGKGCRLTVSVPLLKERHEQDQSIHRG